MRPATMPWLTRANDKQRLNFGSCTPHEPESKAPLRKRCALVKCAEPATLAAKSSNFRLFSRRRPSMCSAPVPGWLSKHMPVHPSRALLGWWLLHEWRMPLSQRQFANNILVILLANCQRDISEKCEILKGGVQVSE